jgi:CrcB protein
LAVNVAGSFAAGLLLEMGTTRLSKRVATAVTVGFLGAFTTYSTFSAQSLTLVRDGRAGAAVTYVGASLVLGLGAALAGILAGGSLLSR